MADSVVTFLLENLSQLLAREANLLLGVEDEVKSLHAELKLINIFLKNSEGKQNEHEMVKELVSQIRDVAYDAEDVIDTFIVNVTKQRKRNFLGKLIHIFDHRSVATRIERIKNNIKEIYDNRDKYGIESTNSGGDEQLENTLRRRRRDVEEDDVVGFDNEAKTLAKQLIEGESRRDVISIIGMGGLGKTTLARKIYNDIFVKDHFNCHAWVYVSQEFRTRELLLGILKCVMPKITEEIHKMKDDELKEMLSKNLEGRRYLIVMDDVWKNELWDEVRASFPDNLNGSRIIITSRIKEVASHASPNPPHFLRFLNKAESWELFSKKVFRGGSCPPELEELGKQIAESCGGLPLAIVVLGGLLATKEKTYRTWSKIIGHERSFLTRDKTQCLDILALSYDHLPRHLKSCFLYIGAFPEDFEIPARQLIQLWIAEGFIPQIGRRNIEDIAEEYLEELIDRSLIQVARRRADGGVKTCRIHDLLRDLCISEALRDKFLEVHMNANSSCSIKPRRLSIHYETRLYVKSNPCDSSCVRSFLSFDKDVCASIISNCQLKQLCEGLKLVRVLDLGTVFFEIGSRGPVTTVPDEIEKLIHLRYLRMNIASSKSKIPPSICNLWNLQTLDIRGSIANCLPKGIWKMQQLRHL